MFQMFQMFATKLKNTKSLDEWSSSVDLVLVSFLLDPGGVGTGLSCYIWQVGTTQAKESVREGGETRERTRRKTFKWLRFVVNRVLKQQRRMSKRERYKTIGLIIQSMTSRENATSWSHCRRFYRPYPQLCVLVLIHNFFVTHTASPTRIRWKRWPKTLSRVDIFKNDIEAYPRNLYFQIQNGTLCRRPKW